MTVEALAAQLAEAQQERDRAQAALEAFEATVDERLGEIDGGHALNEISDKHAAKARGDVLAERDSLRDNAARSRRAADYVRDRLVEAAESAALALLVEPTKDWQVAADAREKAAAILAEREADVAEAQAQLALADTAAEDLRCRFIASAEAARSQRESRKKAQIAWAVRQQSPMALGQIDEAYRAEAQAEMDRRFAESSARREEHDAERGWTRLEPA